MSGVIGLALNIWESSVVSMVLFNAETWLGISNKTIKILDDLFHTFCRIIFRVSVGCPIPSFYIQSGAIRFNNRILQKKLMYVHHLANLEDESLGRFFYEQQVNNKSLPGLVREVENHQKKIGVTNLNGMSKVKVEEMCLQ